MHLNTESYLELAAWQAAATRVLQGSHLSREENNPDTWQHLARVKSELRGTWSLTAKVGDVGEMLDPRWTFLGAGGW